MNIKTIMCYGDSNTWGLDPETKTRYPVNIRWTGLLQQHLGNEFRVIEEGLRGRTTTRDDPAQAGRNGSQLLLPLLESHAPVDLLILMLGTNDLQDTYDYQPDDVANGIQKLIDITLQSKSGANNNPPQILLICPPPIENPTNDFQYLFSKENHKSTSLPFYYRLIAKENGCFFLDASEIVKPSPEDGIHLDEIGHAMLAEQIYSEIKTLPF
jgi:lysophospholipase L1-like esterase